MVTEGNFQLSSLYVLTYVSHMVLVNEMVTTIDKKSGLSRQLWLSQQV